MMKKLLLILFCLTCVHSSFSQRPVNEATITYNISIESSDKTLAKNFEGAKFIVFLKGNQSRTDMVSTLGTESNFYDSKSGSGVILRQYSGQKLMITLTRANWVQKNLFFQNLSFSIDGKEQTVAGLNAKKATGLSPDGKSFSVYFSPDIKLANNLYESSFIKLPGIPVEYEMESGKLTFKYTLSSINYDPVPAAKFEIPKTGFRVMSYDENQQMRKGNK